MITDHSSLAAPQPSRRMRVAVKTGLHASAIPLLSPAHRARSSLFGDPARPEMMANNGRRPSPPPPLGRPRDDRRLGPQPSSAHRDSAASSGSTALAPAVTRPEPFRSVPMGPLATTPVWESLGSLAEILPNGPRTYVLFSGRVVGFRASEPAAPLRGGPGERELDRVTRMAPVTARSHNHCLQR